MDETKETELIKAAQGGDRAAFEQLIGARYDTMLKYAFTYTGSAQDAEDIAQESAIKLARSLHTYNFKSKFSSWLYVLVMNCARDFFRKENRQPAPTEQAFLESAPQSANQEEEHYAAQVLSAIAALPEGEKDALLLVMNDGLSHKEAAKLLGVKESTVSWRIHEARKKLEAQFKTQEAAHG